MTKEEWYLEAKRLQELYISGTISLEEYNRLRDDHNSKLFESRDIMENELLYPGAMLVCKKDLFKSTYNSNAFTKGEEYTINSVDDYYWVKDNQGNLFSFSVLFKWGICDLFEYFNVK